MDDKDLKKQLDPEEISILVEMETLSREMMAELQTAPEFLPSKFWSDINEKNLKMLKQDGIHNFKRTLAQNYYNWLIVSENPQFAFVKNKRPFLSKFVDLSFEMESKVDVQTILTEQKYYLSDEQRMNYGRFVTLLWKLMLKLDTHRLSRRVEEPLLGNPVRIFLRRFFKKQRLISQDLANSIIECNVLCDLDKKGGAKKPKIAEIGAGSGRLAHVYLATQPGAYFIFDIPPALFVSQWYLSSVCKNARIFKFRRFGHFNEIKRNLENCDLAFFTSNQLKKFPENYFDTMVSISTLPEMTPAQVDLFLSEMDRLAGRFIFLKQWLELWQNPLDGTKMMKDDYLFDKAKWDLVMDRIDPANPIFFNKIWSRK
jgi:putative sugar O-methyltransferase